jgi:hypothetical protein
MYQSDDQSDDQQFFNGGDDSQGEYDTYSQDGADNAPPKNLGASKRVGIAHGQELLKTYMNNTGAAAKAMQDEDSDGNGGFTHYKVANTMQKKDS